MQSSGFHQNWRSKRVVFSAFAIVNAILSSGLIYSASAEMNTNIEGIIVAGITAEQILDPNMIYYDKLIPIVLEFKMFPGLTATTTAAGRTRILPRLNCRGDDRPYPTISTSDWLFTCPISFHLNNLLNQLYTNWSDIQQNARPIGPRMLSSVEYQTFANSELSFDECESQLQYWRGINSRDMGLAELKVIIDKCSMASYFEEQIPDFSYPVGPIYELMRDNYVINYFANGSNPANNGGDMLATLVALQSLMTLNFYSEVTRWKEAVASCQNNLIPNALIKSSRLDKALQEIRVKLSTQKYSPSITNLAKYYKLPIADCIYGQTSFFVRILVPVKRDRTVYRSLRISQPRFLYDDELCQVTSSSRSDGAFQFSASGYLVEKISHALVLAGCSGGNGQNTQICKIPERTNIPPADKCLTSVVHENFEGIKTYCQLNCEQILLPHLYGTPLVELPIIHRVESSKFIITLNTITSILIKCESAGLPDQMIPPQKYGAVEVTLPCECYLMFHSDRYFPHEPCSSVSIIHPSIHHAIPIHMVNTSFEVTQFQPWGASTKSRPYYAKRKITISNVSSFVNMTFRDEDIVEVELFDSEEEDYITSRGSSRAHGNGSSESKLIETNSPIQTCGDECCQSHGSIWTMIIIHAVVSLSLLGYLLWKLRGLDKKIEHNRSSISFTNSNHQSQLTLSDKY